MSAPTHPLPLPSVACLQRRAVYARAMGIDVWMPRQALPLASSHYVVSYVVNRVANTVVAKPVADRAAETKAAFATTTATTTSASTPASTTNDQTSSTAGNSSRQALKEGLRRTTVPQAAHRDQAQTSQSANASLAERQGKLPAFELSVIAVDNWLIVDETTQANCAASAYVNWLNALLLAIGKPPAVQLANIDRLRWPEAIGGGQAFLAKSPISERQQAQEMTAVWLSQKLTHEHGNSLLFLGDIANHLFDADHLNLLSVQSAKWRDVQVVRAPASIVLWQDANAKRSLWKDIAPLIDS